ncbi:transmembrane protein 41A-like [Clavelina lepadiformis]|uniref:transmembrane protein 41A-like n=1 Tax=Clavelina lepadiformis TaxID=159417 RepID=UPI004041BBE7
MSIYKSLVGLGIIFGVSTLSLLFLSKQLETKFDIHFPHDLEDLKNMSVVLHQYQQDHYVSVVVLFCAAYLYKQAFAIPGSVFTNVLGGALFGTWIGFPLVCVLSATGATTCFMLSKTFGKQLLISKFPNKLSTLQQQVVANKDRLFYFLLSARLFPMSPNWFLNMASPIIGVPIRSFFLSVLVGLMPYNFICVKTGCILSSVSSMNDMFSFSTFLSMLLVAIVAVLPGVLMKRSSSHDQSGK